MLCSQGRRTCVARPLCAPWCLEPSSWGEQGGRGSSQNTSPKVVFASASTAHQRRQPPFTTFANPPHTSAAFSLPQRSSHGPFEWMGERGIWVTCLGGWGACRQPFPGKPQAPITEQWFFRTIVRRLRVEKPGRKTRRNRRTSELEGRGGAIKRGTKRTPEFPVPTVVLSAKAAHLFASAAAQRGAVWIAIHPTELIGGGGFLSQVWLHPRIQEP